MRSLALLPLTALALAGCGGGQTTAESTDATSSSSYASEAPGASDPPATGSNKVEDWSVEVVADGLEIPWDLAVLPDGDLLVTERAGRISLLSDGTLTEVATLDDTFDKGEAGMMGIALSSDFADTGEFYVCSATKQGDVRVIPYTLADDRDSAERQDPLVTGLPLADNGRHSGCRLLIGPDEMLYVSVGDSAMGPNPQDLQSLGGKVLRVDPQTGQAPPDNPFADSPNQKTKLIYTWGHRNVQGLAVQPGTGAIYSVEHGPDVDDEVNLLAPGANYGWNPVGKGKYNESVPMTDPDISGAVPAVWSTGEQTFALSGAAFLTGSAWGAAEGRLAIAALKGSALYLLDLADGGDSVAVSTVPQFDDKYGRLRSVVVGGDGVVYVTTSNDSDDKILRVTASSA